MARPLSSFLFASRDVAPLPVELALLAARLYAGLALALAHGIGKLPPSPPFVEAVGALGFPAPLAFAWAAALAEAAGGILLALGLLTRPAAIAIAINMAVAGFLRHAADPFRAKELALFFLVTALVFAARGGGRFSVDRLVGGR
jgi:putative oxidoreductase